MKEGELSRSMNKRVLKENIKKVFFPIDEVSYLDQRVS